MPCFYKTRKYKCRAWGLRVLSIIVENKELKLAFDIAMDLTNKKTKNTIYDYVEIVVNNNVIEVRA